MEVGVGEFQLSGMSDDHADFEGNEIQLHVVLTKE